MSDTTNIEWCDSTFNPWIGCTRVSPACDDCYAARSTPARTLGVAWGAGEPRHHTSAETWAKPKQWNAKGFYACANCGGRNEGRDGTDRDGAGTWVCKACGSERLQRVRRRVFCASLADWLDNEVPIQWMVDLLELVRSTPDLDWLLLSKRIGNWSSRISECMGFLDEQTPAAYPLPLRRWLCQWLDGDEAPRNVWIGSTVVNQAEADRDVPKLLQIPAAVRFLSVEPMLGPVDLDCIPWGGRRCSALRGWNTPASGIHWVICGGESGPKARPMHPDWARSLRDQCAAAGVPFLFKQWGEWAELDSHRQRTVSMDTDVGETLASRCNGFISLAGEFVRSMDDASTDDPYRGMQRLGKRVAGRVLDGRTHDGFPGARA